MREVGVAASHFRLLFARETDGLLSTLVKLKLKT